MVSTSSHNGQCQATNRRGQPCRAYAVNGSPYCFWHSPEAAAQRASARQAGGRGRAGRALASHDPVAIAGVGDVVKVVESAINDMLLLENSVARGRTIGYLCGIIVKAIEVSELEEQVRAIQQVLHLRGKQ